MSNSGAVRVILLSVAFVPLWASGFLAGKLATQRTDVLTVLLWRFAIAVVVMGAVALVTRPALAAVPVIAMGSVEQWVPAMAAFMAWPIVIVLIVVLVLIVVPRDRQLATLAGITELVRAARSPLTAPVATPAAPPPVPDPTAMPANEGDELANDPK